MLVVGLGNPGDQYRQTRHNVGFDVVEALAERGGLSLKKPFFRSLQWSGCGPLTLAKPLTFMNRSGVVMPWLLRRCGVDRRSLLIVTDNLDLPAGTVRLKRGGSNLSHRGIASVVDALQNQDFLRLYVGIGRPSKGESVVEHVLGRPEGEDADAITAAIGRAVEAVEALLQQQPEEVMNDLNRRR